MKLTDTAIVLLMKRRSAKSAIITVLTHKHGIYSGYISINKRLFCALQIGNILQIEWSARLSTQLGLLYFELLESMSAFFLHNPNKILALCAVAKTLAKTLPERVPQRKIYDAFYSVLLCMKRSRQWMAQYIKLELIILEQLGFGLELKKCPVTCSTQDLRFISPKTGRAISYTAGTPYKDKLLHLPQALYDINNDIECVQHIETQFVKCLEVINYFLYKHCFEPSNIHIPIERELLYKIFIKN